MVVKFLIRVASWWLENMGADKDLLMWKLAHFVAGHNRGSGGDISFLGISIPILVKSHLENLVTSFSFSPSLATLCVRLIPSAPP